MAIHQTAVAALSEAEYLAGEQWRDVRHEYAEGQVFAMAGGSKEHNAIVLNIASRLKAELRGGPCRAFASDMKVKIGAEPAYYYPDVVVSCSDADRGSESPRYWLREPALIVEVLSPSTEGTDRREKMLAYRKLSSLREYVLVDSERRWAEVYRPDGEGAWRVQIVTPPDELRLESLSVTLSFDDLYDETGV